MVCAGPPPRGLRSVGYQGTPRNHLEVTTERARLPDEVPHQVPPWFHRPTGEGLIARATAVRKVEAGSARRHSLGSSHQSCHPWRMAWAR